MSPLLELFSVVDDVYTEEDALSKEHVYKTAGRIHRAWKNCRKVLDPDFNPDDYPKRPRTIRKGLSQHVRGSPTSSSDQKQTSGKNQKRKKQSGKRSAKRSAKRARSK